MEYRQSTNNSWSGRIRERKETSPAAAGYTPAIPELNLGLHRPSLFTVLALSSPA
jgi:hypothetical protein